MVKFVYVKSSRSFGRCDDCRRRKKRCDERIPECGSCVRRNVQCVYRKPKLKKVSSPGQKVTSKSKIENSFSDYLDYQLDDVGKRWFSIIEKYIPASGKYHQCLERFIPMAGRNTSLLYALCGWGGILELEDHRRTNYYLELSLSLSSELYSKVMGSEGSKSELLELAVTLTCHMMISSFTGGLSECEIGFQQLKKLYKRFGLASFLEETGNTTLSMMLLRWFFYHDVLKLTPSSKFGTTFPLSEYKRILSYANDQQLMISTLDSNNPLMSCCVHLFLLLGELNNFYAEFVAREDFLYKTYHDLAGGLVNRSQEEQYQTITSSAYGAYEDTRIEFHDWVDSQSRCWQEKIDNAKPNLPDITSLEKVQSNELHLTFFEAMQLTLKLFLLSKIRHMSSLDFEVKRLMLHLFRAMRVLLNTDLSSYLGFPLLIAGAVAAEDRDRLTVKLIYFGIISKNSASNFERIWAIIEELWKTNAYGPRFLDWQTVVDKLGLNICAG
ncbi:hypothetical protein OGAPHI_001345 [Ogataea philodendri]|uniref:Zn(2)-C6 fungal-type domain-containing protein n=1 Tax=Ogataea philodendri TaxID=1378263 RepID=A0A9P8PDE4_9ASCO|nr:uncharacterized protein OGAPHI_001345 [Ogataea philodendri]KAH3669224.1 hypothetical protein OGAPHI_001345 [Ogataea philodendri]